jgi:hypothetical protein
MAAHLMASGMRRSIAFVAAFDFLVRHEMCHFQVDLHAAGIELASETPRYMPGRLRQHSAAPGYGIAEEGLANALARESLPRGHRRSLDDWLARSPVGYRDFRLHGSSDRAASWAQVLGDLTVARQLAWTSTSRLMPSLQGEVPIFMVLDEHHSVVAISEAFVGPISGIVETPTFKKELQKSGNETMLRRAWEKRKRILAEGGLTIGSHLEKLEGDLYSVRLTKGFRAGLWHKGTDQWTALAVDQQHDRLYARLKRLQTA